MLNAFGGIIYEMLAIGVPMKFSPWERFDNRENFRGFRFPGIYALAISSRNIAGTPFGYVKEIVYFGMTNSRAGLRGRLNAFNNTLRDKSGPGHGGAERFRYDYEDGEILSRKLYVAICPFECDVTSIDRKDLEAMGEVVRAEYIAFANYAELFGRLPKYNDRHRSPKRKA